MFVLCYLTRSASDAPKSSLALAFLLRSLRL